MTLNRDFTRYLNYFFDNVLPPALRDSKYFMWIFFYPLFGNKTGLFMNFKEKSSSLSEEEFTHYYQLLKDKHIKRETDLNRQTVKYITESVTGDTILDIACGRGYLVKLLAGRYPGKKVVGLDIIPPDLNCGYPNLFIKTGNVENIEFPDKYFDTVICAHTLEHVQNIDVAIKELRRVSKKKLIIIVPRQREYKYSFDLHLHFFPYPDSLKKVMKNPEANYRVIGGDIVYTENK